jgi:hypothetical protein
MAGGIRLFQQALQQRILIDTISGSSDTAINVTPNWANRIHFLIGENF